MSLNIATSAVVIVVCGSLPAPSCNEIVGLAPTPDAASSCFALATSNGNGYLTVQFPGVPAGNGCVAGAHVPCRAPSVMALRSMAIASAWRNLRLLIGPG